MKIPRTILLNAQDGTPLSLSPADGEGNRKISMTAYTGAKFQRFYGDAIIDLSGLDLGTKPFPILKNHDEDQIVGHGSAFLRDGSVIVEGEMSGVCDAANEVASMSDKGFPWQSSMGILMAKVSEIPSGKEVEVNGAKHIGPLIVIRKAKLRETSFVPVGADGATSGVVLSESGDGEIEVEKEIEMEKEKLEEATAAAAKTAKDAELSRLSALQAAFPGREAFVLAQFSAGADVQSAKAALADVLKKENEELKLELSATKKSLADEQAKVKEEGRVDLSGEGPGADQGVGHASGDAPKKKFMELVADYKKEKGCSAEEALRAVSVSNPEEFNRHRRGE